MPIYEYECQDCNRVTENLEKFSDAPLKVCSFCGGKLKRVMSKNTFHLKGSGWFKQVKEKE
jgi:putative FmdB family regulatory protein